MRALLIDDDAELCGMMREFFAQAGHTLETAQDGRNGLKRALNEPFEIVLLDVMLPAINGFSVLQQLRRNSDVPVIMLTARVHRDDKIAGLDKGADDYLTKPFDPDELLARMRAVVRRKRDLEREAPKQRIFGDIEIRIPAREVRRAGASVEFTSLEFDILELLTRAPGRPVSRDEISRTVLGREASPFDRALDVHISHVRDKLGRTRIRTLRGIGYVFVVEP